MAAPGGVRGAVHRSARGSCCAHGLGRHLKHCAILVSNLSSSLVRARMRRPARARGSSRQSLPPHPLPPSPVCPPPPPLSFPEGSPALLERWQDATGGPAGRRAYRLHPAACSLSRGGIPTAHGGISQAARLAHSAPPLLIPLPLSLAIFLAISVPTVMSKPPGGGPQAREAPLQQTRGRNLPCAVSTFSYVWMAAASQR